ncbi:TIGR01244 family sulfur transferase [Mesorhizobium sp. YIM 152430]|uniref:TIGR01244 family sulfur transferase n=1 Tax=Mesorhizobium sp. YIM 152430 TaxID=3031761 RepID=UPI0023D98B29|nr:TIGR01244 family sulfur transferase [Mesorhizobium sp. YIM 152430]MDF1601587.1 TIGR01244 family sulfur transferase [Mesorhizobium sp. YIM 152430]
MKQVSDKLFIAPQLTAGDIRAAKAAGFAAIVNNRPDGEEAGQPTASENRRIAQTAGLDYKHIPVAPGQITRGQVADFHAALNDAEGPVLAHCKTGTRSATLYAIGEVLDSRMAKDDVMPLGQRLGVDLSGAVKWLDANGR